MLDISLWYMEQLQDMFNKSVNQNLKMTKNCIHWKAKYEKLQKSQQELLEKQENIDYQEETFQHLKTQNVSLSNQVSKLSAKNKKLIESLDSMNSELDQHNQQVEDLTTELKYKTMNQDSIVESAEMAHRHNVELEDNVKKLEMENAFLEHFNKAQEMETRRNTELVQTKASKVEVLEGKLTNLQFHFDQVKAQLAELEQRNKGLQKRNEQLETENKRHRDLDEILEKEEAGQLEEIMKMAQS